MITKAGKIILKRTKNVKRQLCTVESSDGQPVILLYPCCALSSERIKRYKKYLKNEKKPNVLAPI